MSQFSHSKAGHSSLSLYFGLVGHQGFILAEE